MEIASVNLARSIWLFDTSELNPRGINLYPQVFGKVIERYKFQTFPKWDEVVNSKDRRFARGQFVLDEVGIEVALEIWKDGLVGETQHSTAATDAFLDDFVQWLGDELRVQYPKNLVKKKSYKSELVVYAQKGLVGLCDKLDSFACEVSKILSAPAELSALAFGSEAKFSAFTFERRINTPYSENKFFSTALLDSESHFALLEKLDRI